MNDMRLTAQQLAAKGRFGDSMLIHVNPAEVAGIASLIPGGLTINPETGLPEAFFFLPFLASMFSAAAPAAAAATAAAAPLATAATGLGTLAATAAPAVELATLAPAAAAAGETAATLAPTLASAGGAGAGIGVDAITTGAIGNAALPASTAVIPTASPGITAALPATTVGAGTSAPGFTAAANAANPLVTSVGAGTSAPAYTTAANTAAAGTPALAPTTTTIPTSVASTGAQAATEETGKSFMGGFGDWIKKNPMMAMGIGAQLLGSLGKLGGDKKKDKKKDVSGIKYEGGDPSFPSSLEGYGTSAMPVEHRFFAARGGLVPGYANGGIVSLAEGGGIDLQAQMPQDMTFPLNGVPGTDEAPMLEDIPSSPFPTSQIGSTPEPPPDTTMEDTVKEGSNLNDHELIAQTVEAIQGKSPDPQPILLAFVKEFGEPALEDLAMRVKSMGAPAGDGQSDSVPAMIDGQQPAALSQGEFVVPADAVSGLGNGSTDAGANHLQGLVDQVRTQRTGSPQQPPALNGGGLVRGYASGGIVSLAEGGKVTPDFDAEKAISGGDLPEWADRWIPSVRGAVLGDPFMTAPAIRAEMARRDKLLEQGRNK